MTRNKVKRSTRGERAVGLIAVIDDGVVVIGDPCGLRAVAAVLGEDEHVGGREHKHAGDGVDCGIRQEVGSASLVGGRDANGVRRLKGLDDDGSMGSRPAGRSVVTDISGVTHDKPADRDAVARRLRLRAGFG